ncbi:septum formation initiator family protein, partial [Patescibacteria group bacterium]|nr:septum formation initiator family protein [Patescibacteria group bacterium]MBU1673209.1 septum formation initiator family protein [Patescibacteria group bacterium]
MPKTKAPKSKRKFSLKAIFYSKIFIVLGIIILIPISISLVKEIIRKAEINNEIKVLEVEIAEIERQNAEMDDLLKTLNSSAFLEKEAKEKFGMQESGEKVVMIPSGPNEFGATTQAEDAVEEYVPNPTKWKNYF